MKNLNLIMSKYVDVLLKENLPQNKTKLVIINNKATVVSCKKVLGSIVVVNNKASFQYEIS